MSKKKISIVCGGPSSEYEVSLSSAQSILDNIDKEKYIPYIFYISKKGKASFYKPKAKVQTPKNVNNLLDEVTKLKDMEMNILALHGEFGEDGLFQTILQSKGYPFTGSNGEVSSLCMNKHKSNSIVGSKIDVRIPDTEIYPLKEIFKNYRYSKEICLKPNAKGSSIGVYLIKSEKDLKRALSELRDSFSPNTLFIIQPLISPAIEVSCGCLEKENGDFIELPPIEIIPKSSDFFDYKAKYTKNASIEITPPEHISKEISERVSKLAVEIHKVLGCKVYSRSDFLIQDGDIFFLETNTLPGMTSTSLLPKEAQAAGISFTELLDFFIENS